MDLLTIIGVASLPGAIIAAVIGMMLSRFEKKMDTKEETRSDRDFLLCKGVVASIELGTTQAKELQEKGHINGNTQQAYDYAMEVKHDIEDFYTRAGSNSMNK